MAPVKIYSGSATGRCKTLPPFNVASFDQFLCKQRDKSICVCGFNKIFVNAFP